MPAIMPSQVLLKLKQAQNPVRLNTGLNCQRLKPALSITQAQSDQAPIRIRVRQLKANQAFITLKKHYPNSEWAKYTKYYY